MDNKSSLDCRQETWLLPAWPEGETLPYPFFCDSRVHQRTSGRVYPCRVTVTPQREKRGERNVSAIVLENAFLELVLLPEFGGRIFSARWKKTNYHFFYRQHVLKPSPIGLLGSWASGGMEFNWPIHHRPSTWQPTSVSIDRSEPDAITVWLGETEPLNRMAGRVGIRLEADACRFETRVRLANQTPFPHSFLWWENAAVPVHPEYRIIFPPDVKYAQFHARRSVTDWPHSNCIYNGHDWRGQGRDLRKHGDTREATSFFAVRSRCDFFGGYDASANRGVLHVADHACAVGKKLFTWGYGPLAAAWERALTDEDGAYAELMAGVYSDNQPDFSWLEPYEEKSFSQWWFPYGGIGEPQAASIAGALAREGTTGHFFATVDLFGATIRKRTVRGWLPAGTIDCKAGERVDFEVPREGAFEICNASGDTLVRYLEASDFPDAAVPVPRLSFPRPQELATAGGRFLAGQHLAQYRDPVDDPVYWWKAALEIDADNWESHNSLGLAALKKGSWEEALTHFRKATEILCRFNNNPRNTEPFFHLGTALRLLGRDTEAREAFERAAWSRSWNAPATWELARLDGRAGNFRRGFERLTAEICLTVTGGTALKGAFAARLGYTAQALLHAETALTHNPFDLMAHHLIDRLTGTNTFWDGIARDVEETVLDLAFSLVAAGLMTEKQVLLNEYQQRFGTEIEHPVLALLSDASCSGTGETCFPSRLEEYKLLSENPSPAALLAQGCFLAGNERYSEALQAWRKAADAFPAGAVPPVLWRNLAFAAFRAEQDAAEARRCMELALAGKPDDPEFLLESDELAELEKMSPEERMRRLAAHPAALASREDLYNRQIRVALLCRNYQKALQLLQAHRFTPCEGGEHALALLWSTPWRAIGHEALLQKNAEKAIEAFLQAQTFPDHLGTGFWNDVMRIPMNLELAAALRLAGRGTEADNILVRIVEWPVDFFTTMYLPEFHCYRAIALAMLGRRKEAGASARLCKTKALAAREVKDCGHFRTTPFVCTFEETARQARTAQSDFEIGLAETVLGNLQQAAERFRAASRSPELALATQLELDYPRQMVW